MKRLEIINTMQNSDKTEAVLGKKSVEKNSIEEEPIYMSMHPTGYADLGLDTSLWAVRDNPPTLPSLRTIPKGKIEPTPRHMGAITKEKGSSQSNGYELMRSGKPVQTGRTDSGVAPLNNGKTTKEKSGGVSFQSSGSSAYEAVTGRRHTVPQGDQKNKGCTHVTRSSSSVSSKSRDRSVYFDCPECRSKKICFGSQNGNKQERRGSGKDSDPSQSRRGSEMLSLSVTGGDLSFQESSPSDSSASVFLDVPDIIVTSPTASGRDNPYFTQRSSTTEESPYYRQKSSGEENPYYRQQSDELRSKLLPEAEDIRCDLRRGIPRDDLNILIIGTVGAGKSSLINSLAMAVDKTGYHEAAWHGCYNPQGAAEKEPVTLDLRPCSLFCYLKNEDDDERYFKCLPRFWDCPGFPDVECDSVATILKLVINGAIPKHTKLNELRTLSPSQLERKYFFHRRNHRSIHLLIFVHAATDPLPLNLLRTVRKVLHGDKHASRDIAVFGVITKRDILEEQGRSSELNEINSSLRAELGIPAERLVTTSLYCSEVTPRMHRSLLVDSEMCYLWKLLVDPVYSEPDGSRVRGSSFHSLSLSKLHL